MTRGTTGPLKRRTGKTPGQRAQQSGSQPLRVEPRKIDILGVQVHDVTLDEALQQIRRMALGDAPHHVSPINPEMVMTAKANAEFRDVLAHVSLGLPDGFGILLAAWRAGTPLRERVSGVDTVRRLAAVAKNSNLSMFLLGAATGVAERAARALCSENPGLRIAGTFSGSPDPRYDDQICSIIERAKPHILLVAYGAPKQDLWIARNMRKLRVPVSMSVGGTFDFLAGIRRRAPEWMQKAGLEWLFRLKEEPHRWRRMLALPQFAATIAFRRTSVQ